MFSLLQKSDQQLAEVEAMEWIVSSLLPDIKKEVRLMNPHTYVRPMECANRVEFALKSQQEDSDAGNAIAAFG